MNMRKVVDTGKKLFKEMSQDDISGLAAELAYRMLLALFPFFIFLTALGGFVASVFNIDNPSARIMENLRDNLPGDAASVLETQLSAVLENQNGGLLSVGILGAIWGASAAMNTIIKALNRAYDVEETRSFWKKTPLALGLTVLGGVFFIGSFSLLIIGQLFAKEIGNAIGLGTVATTALNVLRLPFVILLIIVATAFLYWAAPNAKMPFRWVTPGALMFIVAWIVGTIGFGFYVANFASYNSTYGALGGVVILMIWLYLTSFILLAGAELNAVLQAQVEPETMEAPAGAQQQGEVSESRSESRLGYQAVEDVATEPVPAARASAASDLVGTGTLALVMAMVGLTFMRALFGKGKGKASGQTPRRRLVRARPS